VKGVALAEKLPLFQPETPKDELFLEQFRTLAPDLSIVVSYGHMSRNPPLSRNARLRSWAAGAESLSMCGSFRRRIETSRR